MRSLPVTLSYKGRTEPVIVHVCFADEFKQQLEKYKVYDVAWYTKFGILPGGFAVGREIYVRNLAVLAHELGHVFDLDHPDTFWAGLRYAVVNGFPTMAFTRLLRWRDPEDLRPLANIVMRRLGRQIQS
jgi:hypothetical protein